MKKDERLSRILTHTRDWLKHISGYAKIDIYPQSKREAQIRKRRIFISIFSIAFVVTIIVLLIPLFKQWLNYYNNSILKDATLDNSDWLTFIGSFWGAIIGGITALIASVFTTWLIISRSDRLDRHQQRISNMPILHISISKVMTNKLNETSDIEEFFIHNEIRGACFYFEKDEGCIYKIENIGSGIALHVQQKYLEISEQDKMFFPALAKDEVKYFYCRNNTEDGCKISLEFLDVFENGYTQDFIFTRINDSMIIDEIGMPKLAKPTLRYQYIQ